jgi:hypothetical protein
VLVVALAFVIAATVAEGQTTHAQYVGEVNNRCKQLKRQGKKRLNQIQPSGNPVQDYIRRSSLLAKLLGNFARRVEAVEPPVEDQAAVKSWIADIRLQKRLIERAVRAVKNGQRGRLLVIARKYERVRKITTKQANNLGLTACAGSGS